MKTHALWLVIVLAAYLLGRVQGAKGGELQGIQACYMKFKVYQTVDQSCKKCTFFTPGDPLMSFK